VRKELRRWLRQLHEEVPVTPLLVTRDREEALEVARRVTVLRDGRIEQIGTPEQIYDQPASPFVYDFLGNGNLFSGRMHDGVVVVGETAFAGPETAGSPATDVVAFVRPHDIRVAREAGGPATLAARVVRAQAVGPVAGLELERLDRREPFTVRLSQEQFRRLRPRLGEPVFMELQNGWVFSDDYSI
jgi:sulfate transport system ATP-binding protein